MSAADEPGQYHERAASRFLLHQDGLGVSEPAEFPSRSEKFPVRRLETDPDILPMQGKAVFPLHNATPSGLPQGMTPPPGKESPPVDTVGLQDG